MVNSAIGAALFCTAGVFAFSAVVSKKPAVPVQTVSVNLSSFNWMSDVRLRVDHIEISSAAPQFVGPERPSTLDQIDAPKEAPVAASEEAPKAALQTFAALEEREVVVLKPEPKKVRRTTFTPRVIYRQAKAMPAPKQKKIFAEAAVEPEVKAPVAALTLDDIKVERRALGALEARPEARSEAPVDPISRIEPVPLETEMKGQAEIQPPAPAEAIAPEEEILPEPMEAVTAPIIHDELTVSTSVPTDANPIPLELEEEEVPPPPSPELSTIQNVHSTLQAAFGSALVPGPRALPDQLVIQSLTLDPSPEIVTTQPATLVASVDTQPSGPATVVRSADLEMDGPPSLYTDQETQPSERSVVRLIPKSKKSQLKIEAPRVVMSSPAKPRIIPKAKITVTTQAHPIQVKAIQSPDRSAKPEILIQVEQPAAPARVEAAEEKGAPAYSFPAIPETPPAQKVITTEQGSTIQVRVNPTPEQPKTTQAMGPLPQFGPYLAKNEYPKNDYSNPVSTLTRTDTKGNESRGLSKGEPEGTDSPSEMGPPAEMGQELPPGGLPAKAAVRAPSFIEAFDETTSIPTASSESLTIESPEGAASEEGRAGWSIATATSHLPTLYWINGKPVPVLAKNSAIFLSKLAGTSIQSGTGVVFGKVPAGWTVELSGRAEKPVLLSTSNQPLPSQSTEGDRTFAFFNAEPGAHLLYLVGPQGKSNGGVAAPVLSETATYLDLSIVTKKTVTGRVLDAGAKNSKAIHGAQVRIVGQPSAVAVSNERGEFSVPNVSVISNYPLFVETDAASGFTHRYKVSSGRERDLLLFRMSSEQLTEWIGQLEGGVSSTSGVVVAAVPRPVAANSTFTVYPSTETLSDVANLKPETYTLSGEGHLQVNVPLKPEAARFVSVQVPEGPAVVRLDDQRQAMVWSELVIAQPGIVNVVSAY